MTEAHTSQSIPHPDRVDQVGGEGWPPTWVGGSLWYSRMRSTVNVLFDASDATCHSDAVLIQFR